VRGRGETWGQVVRQFASPKPREWAACRQQPYRQQEVTQSTRWRPQMSCHRKGRQESCNEQRSSRIVGIDKKSIKNSLCGGNKFGTYSPGSFAGGVVFCGGGERPVPVAVRPSRTNGLEFAGGLSVVRRFRPRHGGENSPQCHMPSEAPDPEGVARGRNCTGMTKRLRRPDVAHQNSSGIGASHHKLFNDRIRLRRRTAHGGLRQPFLTCAILAVAVLAGCGARCGNAGC
jgi:hypothetical protein